MQLGAIPGLCVKDATRSAAWSLPKHVQLTLNDEQHRRHCLCHDEWRLCVTQQWAAASWGCCCGQRGCRRRPTWSPRCGRPSRPWRCSTHSGAEPLTCLSLLRRRRMQPPFTLSALHLLPALLPLPDAHSVNTIPRERLAAGLLTLTLVDSQACDRMRGVRRNGGKSGCKHCVLAQQGALKLETGAERITLAQVSFAHIIKSAEPVRKGPFETPANSCL